MPTAVIPACAGMTGFHKQLYRQVYLDTESKRSENARHTYHPLRRIYRFPLNIANMNGTTVRLHWTDQSYKWHVNDGEEVFAVMDGEVDMHYRENGEERIVRLTSGDIFYAGIGTEHVAHPCGEARILVIEKEGSV